MPSPNNHLIPPLIRSSQLRIDGFGTYAVVSALVLNACLRLYTSTQTPPPYPITKPNGDEVIKSTRSGLIFLTTVTMSFLQSLHSAIVFTLIPIYIKTCLGLGLDGKFVEFLGEAERSVVVSSPPLYCIARQPTTFCLSLRSSPFALRQSLQPSTVS